MKPGTAFIFREPPKTTQEYVLWLMKIGHLITKKLNRSLVEEHGVTFNQVRTLFFIKHVGAVDPTKMTLVHLADSLMVSLPNVNGLMKRLQKDGYVNKKPSATDKRAHYLELTKKGQTFLVKLHKNWPPHDLEDLDMFFQTLSVTRKKDFSKTLTKIAEYLQEC